MLTARIILAINQNDSKKRMGNMQNNFRYNSRLDDFLLVYPAGIAIPDIGAKSILIKY